MCKMLATTSAPPALLGRMYALDAAHTHTEKYDYTLCARPPQVHNKVNTP